MNATQVSGNNSKTQSRRQPPAMMTVIVPFPAQYDKPDAVIFGQDVAETAVVMKEHANEIRDHEKQNRKRKGKENKQKRRSLPPKLSLFLPFSRISPRLVLLVPSKLRVEADCFLVSTA